MGSHFVLLNGAADYANPADAMYTTFKLVFLMSFNEFDGDSDALLYANSIIFIITAVLGPIIMLNILIAIANDAYELYLDLGKDSFSRRFKAKIVFKYELLDGVTSGFHWLHVVVPSGQNK